MLVNARIVVATLFIGGALHAAPVTLTVDAETAVYTVPYSISATARVSGGNIKVTQGTTNGELYGDYSFGAQPTSTPVTVSGNSFNFGSRVNLTVTGPDWSDDGIIDDEDGNGLLDISNVQSNLTEWGIGSSRKLNISSSQISSSTLGASAKMVISGAGEMSSYGYLKFLGQPTAVSGGVDASTSSTALDGQNPNFPGRADVLNLTELAGGIVNGSILIENRFSSGQIKIGYVYSDQLFNAAGTGIDTPSISSQNQFTELGISVPFSLLSEDITSDSLTPYLDDFRTTFTIGDFGIDGPLTIHTKTVATYNVQNWRVDVRTGTFTNLALFANGTVNVTYEADLTIWPQSFVLTTEVVPDSVAVRLPETPTLFLSGLGIGVFFIVARRRSNWSTLRVLLFNKT